MKTYPIFRLTVFLAAGIFFANTFWTKIEDGLVLLLPFILLLLFLVLKNRSYGSRHLFGVGVSFFIFMVGVILTGYTWKEIKVEWPAEKVVCRAVVQEMVREKLRTFQARVDIGGKDVLLYLSKDSLSASLMPGDELLVYTQIDASEKREGIVSSDYVRYLYNEGISGTAFVSSDSWKKLNGDKPKDLKLRALWLREQVIGKFLEWGIEMEQLPVLSALTLGCKERLDNDTREAFSAAGISHVLALSGMHVGIIWVLLSGLLRPLVSLRLEWLKGVGVVLVLWLFAFFVGLEASVVRAVVMCMLVEIASLSGLKPFSLNTLSIAAFFMLLYWPFYLFDVGFQLSFVAVASILYLYPLIFHSLSFSGKSRAGRWIWGIMSVSIAAQIGTAPLVMYYFSSFSIYFLLANLVAAVLVPFIIYGTILMFVTACLPGLQCYVVKLLNTLVLALNATAQWAASLPGAVFPVSMLEPMEVAVCYVTLGIWVMYWKSGKRKWLIRGLVFCAGLLGLHLSLLLF